MNLDKYNLGKYDFILVIDKSGSMSCSGSKPGQTRWAEAHEISKNIVETCSKYDDNGLDVVLFSSDAILYKNVTSSDIDKIFLDNNPIGSTATDLALRTALPEYFKSSSKSFFSFSKKPEKVKREKPVIVLVFTDGEPDDEQKVIDAIVEITKKIESRTEVGISFLQLGDSYTASRFLETLDNDLESRGAQFDIVDTKNYKQIKTMSVDEILIGALTD